MTFPDLERLVRPASIAVIGGSVNGTTGAARIIQGLFKVTSVTFCSPGVSACNHFPEPASSPTRNILAT
jgi:hypothetical protein